jgi:hypothetical protein
MFTAHSAMVFGSLTSLAQSVYMSGSVSLILITHHTLHFLKKRSLTKKCEQRAFVAPRLAVTGAYLVFRVDHDSYIRAMKCRYIRY